MLCLSHAHRPRYNLTMKPGLALTITDYMMMEN